MTLNRREFVPLAAAMGASLAWGGSARASTTGWHERRDLYPEGVASGDPDASSVILWTRRPFEPGGRRVLTVEVAEDDAFRRVVAKASAPVSEFVCIPRPITRSDRPDGGPLRYRVVHTASLWKPGERPLLRRQVIEGDPGLSI